MKTKPACLAACVALFLGGGTTLSAYSLLDYYSLKTSTVAGVKPGGQIVVKTLAGERYKGQFLERAGDSLTIRDRAGHTRTFEWNQLSWVRCKSKGVENLAPISFGGKHEVEPESDELSDAH